ncbi:ubiquitin-like-conjugating enzyme ATG10 [Hetaerina americana]|uniref:ubiquitin-like-conjugating enzyme ATG10 n=1 Tax=Hetaerina americana TaxID=62018 RepID=UPI003A7F4270
MGDGEMEWDEFIALTASFLELSEKAGDVWHIKGRKDELGGAYLVRVRRHLAKPREDLQGTCGEEATSVQFWEHHVVYSVGYRVPVLYFNAWRSNGELLSLEEIWNEVHESLKPEDTRALWELITQQEHPVLGKPFFQVHPCRTAKFLISLREVAGRNVLVPWLSSLGPLVNLNLDLSYAYGNDKK